MADREQPVLEKEIMDKTVAYEHREGPRRTSIVQAYDRRHSAILAAGRRESLRKSFDNANLAMVFPDTTHLEVSDDEGDSIDDIAVSWFVWLVALTASIAGSLFGYDTGIISAVLVYLNNDLNGRPTSANEKELITSLCSGGAFVGAIVAGLTADKVCPSEKSCISKSLTY